MRKSTRFSIERRRLAIAAAAVPISLTAFGAEPTFPDRPVTLIIPSSPGGILDLVGRRLAERLDALWNQRVVVLNQPGAAANTGAAAAARSKGDGYTLLLTLHDGLIIARAAHMKVGYDPMVDLAPVGLVGPSVTMLVVRQDSPFKTLADVIAEARLHPGTLVFGGNGIGTSLHFGLEQFQTQAGISLLHVPYKGGAPAMLDLLAGRVNMMFATVSLAKGYLDAGSIRVIAIANAQRTDLYPTVPTMSESGVPGFEIPTGVGTGLFAPGTTPAPLVARLNTDLGKVMAEPATNAWLRSMGIVPQPMTPAQYRAWLAAQVVEIEGLIRKFDIKLE